MKKASNRLLVLAMLCVAITGVSCNKLLDYVNNDSGGGASASKYRIKSIKGFGEYDTATLVVSYNKYGNPVRLDAYPTTTGRPNSFYKYDSKQRLTDRITYYNEDTVYDIYNKFMYDVSGQPTGDTSYYFGLYKSDGPVTYTAKIYSRYTLDNYGRIIKAARQVLYPGNYYFEDIYTYDIKGNRTWNNMVEVRDDKVNILRTNAHFMFLEKDYSLNNAFVADTYNHAKLPLAFSIAGDYPHFYFLGAAVPAKKVFIEYEKQ